MEIQIAGAVLIAFIMGMIIGFRTGLSKTANYLLRVFTYEYPDIDANKIKQMMKKYKNRKDHD